MKKVYPHELIGQEIEIIESKNKSNQNIKGKIVDETKHTIKISQQKTIKTIMKNNIIFKIKGNIIKGKDINYRSEERMKK